MRLFEILSEIVARRGGVSIFVPLNNRNCVSFFPAEVDGQSDARTATESLAAVSLRPCSPLRKQLRDPLGGRRIFSLEKERAGTGALVSDTLDICRRPSGMTRPTLFR